MRMMPGSQEAFANMTAADCRLVRRDVMFRLRPQIRRLGVYLLASAAIFFSVWLVAHTGWFRWSDYTVASTLYMVLGVLGVILAVKTVPRITTTTRLLRVKRKYCLTASVFLNPDSDGVCLFEIDQSIVRLHTPQDPSLRDIGALLDRMTDGESVIVEATGRNGVIFFVRPLSDETPS